MPYREGDVIDTQTGRGTMFTRFTVVRVDEVGDGDEQLLLVRDQIGETFKVTTSVLFNWPSG